MLPRVYIETSIPSFYHEIRGEPEMAARREWTRDWWDRHRARYTIVTSIPVIEELEVGDHPRKQECLRLIENIALLPIPDLIVEIVDA